MSAICYVYLADVHAFDAQISLGKAHFEKSQWWTRGWTLQELLAPSNLIFFSSTWGYIERKDEFSLSEAIAEISGIDINVLNGTISLDSISIAQRMSWAASRFTSRVEDMAYSLIGIFSVNMPLLYGEGQRAFLRLQQEIMKESDDETMFAWDDQDSGSRDVPDTQALQGLLATRPAAFHSSRHFSQLHADGTGIPYAMTNSGLSISLQLQTISQDMFTAWLRCVDSTTNTRIGVHLKKISSASAQYARVGDSVRNYGSVLPQTRTVPLYVKQHHGQIPAYSKLDHIQRKILLIQVLPTEDSSSLKLKMLSADIETAKYTALSYMWDTPHKFSCEVSINSDQVKIPEKIFRFLHNTQSSSSVLYWIDAICIHQINVEEWQHQQLLLSEIYRHAFQVAVILDNINPFGTTYGAAEDSRPLPPTRLWLKTIAADRYWTRAWLFQDFLLARDVIFYSDTTRLPDSTLAQLYFGVIDSRSAWSVNHFQDFERIYPFLRFARSTMGFRTKAETTNVEQPLSDQPHQVSFETLIVSARFLTSLAPCDRVYSLVNVCDLGPDFHISHSESVEELFCRVVAARGDRLTAEASSYLQRALGLKCER